ncbi:hypothetical protein D0T11_14060 [Hymenobacter rubripertinctus]|uniref:Uncharacterized protein n=1 Tax=Hymenobacter rubripertinctus TaxID=2029981 RepID=A0A418QU05_9BACT|nr:hypothetical protein D0T11_14060 [Hymenobacter rubripertinctus]
MPEKIALTGVAVRPRKPGRRSFPTPYSLLPTPYSLLPTPYSLLPHANGTRAASRVVVMRCHWG